MQNSYMPTLSQPLTNSNNSLRGRITDLLGRFWFVIVLILVVFVGIIIYHKTIGYYMEIGYRRVKQAIGGEEEITMDIGEPEDEGIKATIKPMAPMAPPSERPSGMPGASEGGSDLLGSLSSMAPPRKEVFNVSRNIYTYNDAAAVCAAYGADVASYEQVKEAYEHGADWCNYGWVKGQMAVYPTQKETYEKLQKGAPEYRNACGQVGVNGGYFDNPELRFGVNCYGSRPAKNANSELAESAVALPQSTEEIEFDKRVQKFREQMNTATILPFRRGQWTS
jgi:hypothetical protein